MDKQRAGWVDLPIGSPVSNVCKQDLPTAELMRDPSPVRCSLAGRFERGLAESRPARRLGDLRRAGLDVDRFSDFQCVVDLDARVSYCALELFVSEQQLDSPEVFSATVDRGRLGAAQQVGAVLFRITVY